MRVAPAGLILILSLGFSLKASAQYYDTGEDPASVKWLQIKTDRFRVIYPESYGKEGVNFARTLDYAYSELVNYYGERKFRIPVIIHNYTVKSNGYVAWAPRRMELFPTPEQNAVPMDNALQLSLHEMTHVMQMSSLRQGISGILSLPLGEHYIGAIAGFLPMWFMEGDAVLMETMLSESGRGRAPSFNKEVKALAVERGKMYSYDKILLGSYRNFTPDEYKYGYRMVEWVAKNQGYNVWNKALGFTAKYPFTIVPFNLGLSSGAGLTKQKVFTQTFRSLAGEWKKEEERFPTDSYLPVNTSKGRNYINYYSPVIAGSGHIAAIKVSMYDPPAIVMINTATGEEKKLVTPGYLYPYFISGAAGKIVWVETQPDPRWANREYSVIRLYDINRGSVRQLTFRSRYMAAAISPDGRFIAAVENSVSNENSVSIVDAFNGDILEKFNVPGNLYPQRPQWSPSGDRITFISLSGEGEGIICLDTKNGTWQTLLKQGRNDIQSAFLRNDSLFYISSASSADNLWLLTPSGEEKRLTGSRFGVYDITLTGDTLFFTDYKMSGYDICMLSLRKVSIREAHSQFDTKLLPDIQRNSVNKLTETGGAPEYTPKPYRKWLHPLRVHSWLPFYADIEQVKSDPLALSPGLTLFSQNDLSTLVTTAGYERSNGFDYLHLGLTWKGWFPVIETGADYGGYPEILKFSNNVPDPSFVPVALKFRNTVSLPLSFRRGNLSAYIRPSVTAVHNTSLIYIKESNVYDRGQTEMTGRAFLSLYSASGMRDIYPRWALVADYSYTSFPWDRDIYGTMSTFSTTLYMPGLVKNHGLRLRYNTDHQNPEKLVLYNRAEWPRSYSNIISKELNSFSADYVFPLLYPDLNIPSFLYVKRLRGGLFYDYATGTDNIYLQSSGNIYVNKTETFRSFGTELLADFFVLRIPFMISGGVEAAWRNVNEAPWFRLIFNIDIYGMMVGRYRM